MTLWSKYTPFKNYWLKKGPNHYHYHRCNHQFHQFHWFHYLHSFTLWPFLSSLLSSVSLGSILTLFYSVAFSIITTIISFSRFAIFFWFAILQGLLHIFSRLAGFTWFTIFICLPFSLGLLFLLGSLFSLCLLF